MTARNAIFAWMLAVSVALLAFGAVRRRDQAGTRVAETFLASADVSARLGIASLPELTPERAQADPFLRASAAHYRRAALSPSASPVVMRRAGILIGVVDGPEAAWQWFQAHPDPERADLWRAAYGPDPITPGMLRSALARLGSMRGSWYLELVRWQLHRKAGQADQAATVLQGLRERFGRFRARLMLLAALGTMAGAAGLFLWLLVLLFWRQVPRSQAPLPFAALPPHALAEVFILWFFVYTAGGWLLGRLLHPHLTDGAHTPRVWMLAAMLALQVVAALAGAALLRCHLRRGERAVRDLPTAGEPPPTFPPSEGTRREGDAGRHT
ncbi:MAG: hypothetical protein QHJ73_16110, partial [Armatimonadota bacterium]|nr:hypothetical protein [Armatimonadota bacterium]